MPDNPLIVSFEHADPSQVGLLGAKGAKLVEDFRHVREFFPGMQDKIAVPDGFILSVSFWKHFYRNGSRLPDELFASVLSELTALEARTGRRFGDRTGRMPLIVAVRGGAPLSFPGALSTILNVGFNDEIVSALIAGGESESFVLTTYLTAIRMYGEVVLEIPYDSFYSIIKGAGDEGSLSVPLLRELIDAFKGVLLKADHPHFPAGFECRIHQQLRNAIDSVLSSWMSPTAIEARRSRSREVNIPEDMGTAVVIQEMVFGNREDRCCLSGVLFTREQRTGANAPIVEWSPKVQCDKIVSGKLRKRLFQAEDMKEVFPEIYERLLKVRNELETRAKRPLDIEFTVEGGKIFLVQRRPMRMTSNATVRAMWDFIEEGKTSIQLASMVINRALEQPEKYLRDGFSGYEVLARGKPITDSADVGTLVFGTEQAIRLAELGEQVVMLRKRPYGEADVAVNHPNVRGIIRVDGNTTGHEAVSAVAYSKPYLINTRDAEGRPLIVADGEELVPNPESILTQYLGKRVFVDGERGIVGYTEEADFLEDTRGRKKLYVDWEYVKQQFNEAGYRECSYEELLDLHYEFELQLEEYQQLEKNLLAGTEAGKEDLVHVFNTWLRCFPERDRKRAMELKELTVEDFDLGPPLVYKGSQLGPEVLKVLHTLMLSTTWWTHWLHEILVIKALERGETESDVIRDISLKNRTMRLVRGFELEGFHVMKTADSYHLILASNFEYEENPDKIQIGPDTLQYREKELLAQQFMGYLEEVNPPLRERVRVVQGEPPLGQGHARIVSIGISMPHEELDLVCRYLRSFLDRYQQELAGDPASRVPKNGFVELYQLDPFFAPYPDLRITQEFGGAAAEEDFFLSFGGCSFGEFNGEIYGKEDYDRLTARVKKFERYLQKRGKPLAIRPWHFEIDPFRRHSLIAAVGIRFDKGAVRDVLESLKDFVADDKDGK